MLTPPRVLATAIALAALSACGSGSLPLLPSAGGAAGAEDSRAMASGMSAPYLSVRYSLSKDFKDDLPDEATAYEMERTTSAGAVTKLAKALGVTGKLAETKEEWIVTSGERTVRVTKAGGLPFALDGGEAVSSGYACAEAQSVPPSSPPPDQPAEARSSETKPNESKPADAKPGESVAPVDDPRCAEPTRNPELPPDGAATKIARDALSDAGLDLDGAKVTADGGFDSWNVTVQHRVGDTTTSGLVSTVLVGPKGRILTAYGMLGRPKALGDYPLVTAAKAVDRLNELQNGGGTLRGKPEPADVDDRGPESKPADQPGGVGGGSPSRGGDEPAPDAPTMVPPGLVACDDATASCDPPTPDPPTLPEPATHEIVLTKAEAALTVVGDFRPRGDLHLVPAFSFTAADGGEAQVEAVTDEHLRKQSPEPEPAPPADTGDGDGGGSAGDGGTCSAQMPTPAPDGNQPIVLEVCVDPAKAKVGQEVTFTIKAKDADGSFVDGPCEAPVTPRYGDEGDDEGAARCMACPKATEGKREYETKLKHTYSKPGSYNATFDVHSGSSCDPRPGDSKGTIDIRVEVIN